MQSHSIPQAFYTFGTASPLSASLLSLVVEAPEAVASISLYAEWGLASEVVSRLVGSLVVVRSPVTLPSLVASGLGKYFLLGMSALWILFAGLCLYGFEEGCEKRSGGDELTVESSRTHLRPSAKNYRNIQSPTCPLPGPLETLSPPRKLLPPPRRSGTHKYQC